jgi:hypothetical protein
MACFLLENTGFESSLSLFFGGGGEVGGSHLRVDQGVMWVFILVEHLQIGGHLLSTVCAGVSTSVAK